MKPAVDYPSLVSRADITYDRPVERSEAGLPVGNGRMGSLVWTTPTGLRFQINRADVFAVNCATSSFPERDSDYGSGCGFLDLHFVEYGEDVFAGEEFRQHLGVYDGLMTVQGKGVTARVLAWHERDIIAVEIEDRRESAAAVSVDLRMLRFALQYFRGRNFEMARRHEVAVRTRNHTATSRLEIRDGRILLTQEFREGDYYNASAVAVGAVGRPSQARYLNESTVRLVVAPGQGRFTLLIASAARFDPEQDVAALALTEMNAAAVHPFEAHLSRNRTWWHYFWSGAFIQLHSENGVADEVERNYTYFLYVMASCSRGAYPPRFGGMLWLTNGDLRQWGSAFWWANMSCYYNGLLPADRPELMDPLFAMYSGMYDSCARAARQQWGVGSGVWLPETTWFDGLEVLPEEIAAEMRELYLLRKPWEQRSEAFRRFAESKSSFNSRWNWIDNRQPWVQGRWTVSDKGAGPFGHVTHIFATTANIAYLFWLRYEYSQDSAWLRERAYPMLKGAVEFYRHFPNLIKEEDGRYHLHHVNSNEPAWGARDTDEELSAMRGALGALLRAAEILDEDVALRPIWQELLENLAPLPTTDDPEAIKPADYHGPRVWVKGRRPVVRGSGLLPDPNTLPMWNFDLCTLETQDPEVMQTANATFDAYFPHGIGPQTPVSVLSRLPIAAAALGRSEAVRTLIPNQIRCLAAERDFCDWVGTGEAAILSNRLTLREGAGAIECQRLGRAAEALHTALLQSVPAAPGGDPLLHLFPAWPREWDAAYTLLARGAFLVSSAMEKGQISFVEIQSQAGAECRLRNPWPERTVALSRGGRKAEELSGTLLTLATAPGETLTLVPRDPKPLRSHPFREARCRR